MGNKKADPYDDGSDPDPWCTSPEKPDPKEQTDRAEADYHPDRWNEGSDG